MSRRGGGFTLVLVRGGGTRVMHVGCARGFVLTALFGVALGLGLLGGTWWDYFALKQAQLRAASIERRVQEQRALLETFEQRVAEINREVGAWQEAHLRVWSTFGPSSGVSGKGTGMGGSALPDIPAEFSQEEYKRGSVGAARTQNPNSANSQFFICFGAGCRQLTGQYTLWGEVIEGMDTVDKIARGEPPPQPDKMTKVYLLADKK